MKQPINYFSDGYEAAQRDLPTSSCPLLFMAWPRDAWLAGHAFYGQFTLKQREPEPAYLDRAPLNVWDQGANAYKRGIAIEDCPYDPTSGDGMIWQAGWVSETPHPLKHAGKWTRRLEVAIIAAVCIAGLLWAFVFN